MTKRTEKQFHSNEQLSVQVSHDNRTPAHRHDYLEFAYVTEGSAMQGFHDHTVRVRAGDFFMINYGEVHWYEPAGDDPFTVANILFQPEFLDPSLRDCRGFPDLVAFSGIGCNYFNLLASPTSVIFHDDTGEVRYLIDRMDAEYREDRPKRIELLRAYLTELLLLTLRKIYKRSDELDPDDRILTPILDYMEQHFREPITLRSIGERTGYTPSYLSTLFARKLGIPFSRYLQNLRIAAACQMLCATEDSVESIAAACGYGDIKFFREVFRSRLRVTPSEFRRVSRRNARL